MSRLEYILGGSGTGKSTMIFEDLKRELLTDSKASIFIIVPDQYSFQTEKSYSALLASGVKDPYTRVSIMSISSLARLIMTYKGGICNTVIDSGGKAILTYMALKSVRDDLEVYKSLSSGSGFIRTLSESLNEFKQFNLKPSMFSLIAGGMKNETFAARLRDISRIFEGYESLLHEKYIDTSDALSMAAEKCASMSMLEGAIVYYDEFTGFTPNQLELIEAIYKMSEKTVFSLTVESDILFSGMKESLFIRSMTTMEKLNEMAHRHGDEPKLVFTESNFARFKSPDLKLLADNYYKTRPRKYDEIPQGITLKEYNNLFDEVYSICTQINRLVKLEGARYNDIAVTVRNISTYDYIFRAVFNEFKIPYFIDRKLDAASNPLISLVIDLLKLKENSFSYDSVFSLLKNTLLYTDDEEIFELENFALANNIYSIKWKRSIESFRTIRNIDMDNEDMSEQLDRLEGLRIKYIQPLLDFTAGLSSRNKPSGYIDRVLDFLREMRVHHRIDELIEDFKRDKNQTAVLEYSQIWRVLTDSFAQLIETTGDDKISYDDFVMMMDMCLGQYRLGVVPLGMDQVIISSIPRMKKPQIKYMFAAGINDGVFPNTIKEDDILSDADRRNLLERGIQTDFDSVYKSFEEEFSVYKLLTCAERGLFLSWPIAQNDGTAMRPSMIISRIRRIFPKLKIDSYIDGQTVVDETSPSSLVDALREAVSRDIINLDMGYWYPTFMGMLEKSSYSLGLRAFEDGYFNRNIPAKIGYELASRLYKNRNISISRLEKFNSCPYSFFMEYGIKAKEREVYDFSYADLGSLIHKIVDLFNKSINEGSMSWDELTRGVIDEQVEEIIEDILKNYPDYILNSKKKYSFYKNRYKRMIGESLEAVSHQIRSGKFVPRYSEVEFSEKGTFKPLTIIPEDKQRFSVIGRVDRVDICEDNGETLVKIVDYKTGSKTFSLEEVYNSSQIQLIVYLKAVTDALRAKPAAGFYNTMRKDFLQIDADASAERIAEEKLKQYIPNGIFIGDEDIISKFDEDFSPERAASSVVELKGRGKNKSLKNIVSYEDFDVITGYVEKGITNICNSMLRGETDIKPLINEKDRKSACTYCSYRTVCRFNPTTGGNEYKRQKSIPKDIRNQKIDADEKLIMAMRKELE